MNNIEVSDLKLKIIEECLIQFNDQKNFVTLDAWKNSRAVKIFFYKKILPGLPAEEKLNLAIQIRKAATSITLNIAEGYGRFHYKEEAQFYRISRGSLYELLDALICCFDLDYISEEIFREGFALIEEAKKMLNGYVRYILNQKKIIE
ncbi:MAG TPA: four helix bundle protein [Bacteroidia bacterium]|jgi:four helix bundle protein